jgi:hypothetical protein
MGIGCRFNSVCISLVSWWVLAISFYYSDSNGRSRRSPSGLCCNPYHYDQSYTMASKRSHSCAVRALAAHLLPCFCISRHCHQTISVFHTYLPTMLQINLPGACSHYWHFGLTRPFFRVHLDRITVVTTRTIIPFLSSPTVQPATAFDTETESCLERKWT